MLVISTQNWSILAKFAKKNPAKSAVFYWLFLGEVSPRNFPWNRLIFPRICSLWTGLWWSHRLRICPWKSSKFHFFPLKSREIGRFFRKFAPENPAKFSLFLREISEALTRLPRIRCRRSVYLSSIAKTLTLNRS